MPSLPTIASIILPLLMFAVLPSIDACTCLGGTFRDFYDRAHLVVKAKVLRVTIEQTPTPTPAPSPCLSGQPCAILVPIGRSPQVDYKLLAQTVYKGCAPKTRLFQGRSVSRLFGCGAILLQTSQVYMLNLFEPVREGKGKAYFSVGSCQGIKRFEDLSAQEMWFLQRQAENRTTKC